MFLFYYAEKQQMNSYVSTVHVISLLGDWTEDATRVYFPSKYSELMVSLLVAAVSRKNLVLYVLFARRLDSWINVNKRFKQRAVLNGECQLGWFKWNLEENWRGNDCNEVSKQ